MSNIYAVVGGAHNSTPAPFDEQLTGSTLDPELQSLIDSIPDEDPFEADLDNLSLCDSCGEWHPSHLVKSYDAGDGCYSCCEICEINSIPSDEEIARINNEASDNHAFSQLWQAAESGNERTLSALMLLYRHSIRTHEAAQLMDVCMEVRG